MNYIRISCYKSSIKDYKEKQSIFLKFFENRDNNNIGFIKKFNNAIGYSKYLLKRKDGIIVDSEIPECKYFKTPYELIYDSIHIYDYYNNNEIINFYIPKGKQIHSVTNESYDNFDIAFKFWLFLNKVFPMLDIDIELVNEDLYKSKKDIVFTNILFSDNEYPYSFDMFLDEPLSLNELKNVYDYLDYSHLNNYEFVQRYCDCSSCKFSTTPYHAELSYNHSLGKINHKET